MITLTFRTEKLCKKRLQIICWQLYLKLKLLNTIPPVYLIILIKCITTLHISYMYSILQTILKKGSMIVLNILLSSPLCCVFNILSVYLICYYPVYFDVQNTAVYEAEGLSSNIPFYCTNFTCLINT